MPSRTSAAQSQICNVMACLIIGVLSGPVQLPSQEAEPDSTVRQRVEAFWTAMQKEDYATATQFMHPDSRDTFQHRIPKTRVTSFRFSTLECNPERTACDATVLVTKPIAILSAQEVEWPLKSHWVLEQGTWYFKLDTSANRNVLAEMFRAQQDTADKLARENQAPPKKAPRPARPDRSQFRTFDPDPSNPQMMRRGEKAVFKFNFTNRTREPLRIVSVHADCHCTSISSSNRDVPPGQTAVIEATLDTFGLPLGPIEKNIQVTFADLPDPVGIRLATTSEPNFEVEPSSIDFGTLPAGRPAERSLRIVNHGGQTVMLQHVVSGPSVRLSPESAVLAPGKEISIAVRYSAGAPGDFAESLMIKTDLPTEPLITIIAKGKVAN